jgi:hypothetical protein
MASIWRIYVNELEKYLSYQAGSFIGAGSHGSAFCLCVVSIGNVYHIMMYEALQAIAVIPCQRYVNSIDQFSHFNNALQFSILAAK